MRELLARIRMLLQRSRAEREIDEEMRLHLELRRERLRARGFPDREAADRARRAFGSPLRIREAVADAWGWTWLDALGADLRSGLRQLWRAPKYTLFSMAILTGGAGVALAVLRLADAALFHQLSIPGADAIVRLSHDPTSLVSRFPFGAVSFYREHGTLFAWLISESRGVRIAVGDDPEPQTSAFVSENYFRELRVNPALGRLLDERDADPRSSPAVVLGHQC